jgi:vancomycin permeability regulator SanA
MKITRVVIAFLIVIGLASQAARFLLVDAPQPSDAIVVLAGDTRIRPARGLELLRQGMAPHLFLDVETHDEVYGQRLTDLAANYLKGLPEASASSVCPVTGFSTNAETEDVRRCLDTVHAHRVLIVTSDYHTRRALTIFRQRLPAYQFTAAAAHDPSHFGTAWWTHREWAKATFDEWTKLIWFEAVDRWR